MQLGRLIKSIITLDPELIPETRIEGLAYDSRKVKSGFLFVALRGHLQDGHNFIEAAIKNGAVAVVAESFREVKKEKSDAVFIEVPDSRAALAALAATYYVNPFSGLNLIGITGTNGKTTTSYLIEAILHEAGAIPGVIGTINYRSLNETWQAPVTTPESLEVMEILRKMADDGVTDVVMEVSSHALDQGRVRACPFRVAVFTNLSRDHLDYHHSMEEYFEAKSLLFRGLDKKGGADNPKAVINVDDPRGKDLIKITNVPAITYGLRQDCDVRAEDIKTSRTGLTATLITPSGKITIRSALIGDYNIYNIMAAAAAALCLGIAHEAISAGVSSLKGVPGRLEAVKNNRSLTIVVDYAHTPDALTKALTALKPLVEGGRMITVFGCGGDRDQGKRSLMGYAACKQSDVVFITSDNPRTEEPMAIISQIEEGASQSGATRYNASSEYKRGQTFYFIDPDRARTIKRAVEMADKNDLILIAGKGHEDYQIIGKEKRHFDDREVAAEAAS
ncbi:UDP-N-acetylmuramoyl-L-alanyl-D-glutamate--2, 6-diaminopimelate ligase [uncultured Desulfobacterium sp.]|uniref:UDP-N-acetylmuramoyl-L-alanyl-D-glutamate--2,6-diaminopimelate ligase n=1 Tax=uncultured Desulfobacterium sp. TaxID=201089 RepID=A0A445MW93_9BACT|nr:UDP-N-acetylmuramoyl-L-alanyl-D-glutamate--2, 6-diaminopimelate ligase [uncultured Desulfobacterium sp.]